jgi:hypothetical protein
MIQANRLCELQNYKTLCERRISQLNPTEIFPINEKILDMYESQIPKTNHNQMSFGNFPGIGNGNGTNPNESLNSIESLNKKDTYNQLLNVNK